MIQTTSEGVHFLSNKFIITYGIKTKKLIIHYLSLPAWIYDADELSISQFIRKHDSSLDKKITRLFYMKFNYHIDEKLYLKIFLLNHIKESVYGDVENLRKTNIGKIDVDLLLFDIYNLESELNTGEVLRYDLVHLDHYFLYAKL